MVTKEKILSYYPYKKIIKKMFEEDQRMRFSTNWDDKVDEKHLPILKDILNKIGVPTIDKVGIESSKYFIILVIHQDKAKEFQKQFLDLAINENIDKATLAHLIDRVEINYGRKQIYGSQLSFNETTNLLEPKDIKDPKKVNQLRKEVGLEPLEEYIEYCNKQQTLQKKK